MTPEGWRFARLDEVARIVGGGTPAREQPEFWGGIIPWATPTDITGLRGREIHKTASTITAAAIESSSAAVLPPGTVLMTSRATIGACAINRVPMATNQGFQSLVPGGSVTSEYLYYLLGDIRPQLVRLAAGSTFLEISKRSLAALSITVPPLPEQRKIAAILSSIDEAIEATQAVIDQLGVVKKAMMAELLTRGLPGRHTKFKQTEIGEVPERWEIAALEQLCSEVVDCPHTTPKYVERGFPVIRTADVIPGRMLVRQAKNVSEDTLRERTRRLPPRVGDIFYSREGERFGIAAPVPDGVRTCVGQRMMHLRASEESDPSFLMWLMNSPIVYGQAVAAVGGSTSPHVNVASVRRFVVPRPPLDEQAGIARAIDSVEGRTVTEEQARDRLVEIKSALMSVLLTGELRVKPDEDAP